MKNNDELDLSALKTVRDNLYKQSLAKEKHEINGTLNKNKNLTSTFKRRALLIVAGVAVIGLGVLGSHKLQQKDMYDNYMRTVKIIAEEELDSYTAINEFEKNYHPEKKEVLKAINEILSTMDEKDYSKDGKPDNYVAFTGVTPKQQEASNEYAAQEVDEFESNIKK